MATKAYLSAEDFEEGKRLFLASKFDIAASLKCSQWLSEKLEYRLATLDGWAEVKPIRLGSWAREELCPKSDVDLLLVGDERAVSTFVSSAQKLGIKIRSRMPEDAQNWTVGVEPFDFSALLTARAFTPDVEDQLKNQKELLLKQANLKRRILSAIRKERLERQRRYDSISNYLEPQLKFGAGGLRDLEQALIAKDLFPKPFQVGDEEAFQKIVDTKKYLLCLRQAVHWFGGGDVLAAGYQADIARSLGYANLSELMKDVQIRLERASFYADWVVDRTTHAPVPVEKRFTPVRVISLFSKDPSLSNQYLVRRQSREIWKGRSDKDRGHFLKSLFNRHRTDKFWTALTRSLCLEECLTELKTVKGLTQHDHYHRYTVETHLYQAIRETDRIYASPKWLYSLKSAAKDLRSADWAILRWTALFHDLGKGRNVDHSTVGADLVRTRLKAMGMPTQLITEVEWMVTNHLLLTTAAFRQNANSPTTWKRLFDRGVTGIRLQRLMIFSAIDIRATNPEAWNSWKAQLLAELFVKLCSPTALSHQKFFKQLAATKARLSPDVLADLDSFLIETLPRNLLVNDLKKVAVAKSDLPLLVQRRTAHQLWVRFHRKEDRPGLFFEFVQRLFWASARIDAASVMTLKQHGVYDWFLVRSMKTPRELSERLQRGTAAYNVAVPPVRFQSVEVVSDDQKEWILSFRGRDQKGLLLAAAQALFDIGLAIHWARVHTWGSQIDDIFCVEAKGDLANHLRLLQEKFVT